MEEAGCRRCRSGSFKYKNAETTAQLHSSHTLVKQCSKFSRPGFRNMWTVNFQMFKLVLGKADIKLPTSTRSSKKQEFQKNINFCFIDYAKAFDCVDHIITLNCGKFWKRWEYQTIWPASWETCMKVGKQRLEQDMEQQTGSKLGKEYIKALYSHHAYLTYMQSISWEMLGWMKHKLESRLIREISITSDMQMTPPLWQESKKN